MKTKILASLLGLAVLAMVASAGTLAYFTDTEIVEDNRFIAGTINLSVNPDTGQVVETVDGDLDLKPSQTGYITIDLTNEGTNPLEVWKHIADVENEGGLNPEPEREFCGDADPECSDRLMSNRIHYDMTVDCVGCASPGVEITEDEGFMLTGPRRVASYWIYLGIIPAQQTMTVEQSYHLDADVGNWAQGDIVCFDIEFFAQQTQGDPQPPAPVPELPDYGRPT